MIHKIETSNDLAVWCQAVNQPLKTMCDLQDVYARSDEKLIRDIFLEQPMNDKEFTIFAIQKCMGSDPMFRLMKSWARNQAEIVIEDNDKMLNERLSKLQERSLDLSQEKVEFEHEKESYQLTIRNLESRLQAMTDYNDDLTEINSKLYRHELELESEAAELHSIIEENSKFEEKIKAMLNS